MDKNTFFDKYTADEAYAESLEEARRTLAASPKRTEFYRMIFAEFGDPETCEVVTRGAMQCGKTTAAKLINREVKEQD